MTIETLRQNIIETLRTMNDSDLVALHNEYCGETNNFDDTIYTMDMFDELFTGSDPLDVAARVFYGTDENREESSFNPNRDYFYFNGYGNPVSLDYVSYIEYRKDYLCDIIDEPNIVDYIIEYEDSLNNSDIDDILSDYLDELEN